MSFGYDAWKTSYTEPDYLTEEDMTRLDELEKFREHLSNATRELLAAEHSAVLSRGRRSRLESIMTEAYDLIGDVEEELSHR